MNLQKFYPATLLFFRYVKQGIKSHKMTKVLSQVTPTAFTTFSINGLAWAFIWPTKKQKDIQTGTQARVIEEILKKTDDLFENGHYDECYNVLKDAHKLEKNVEVLWRITRVLYNMSKDQKYDKDQKKKYVLEAFAVIASELENNTDNFAVQKWYALLLDAKSSLEGVSERIKQLENVKKHMDLAVTLNPNDATTLYMLGEWCYQITEMPWHQRKIAEVLFATPPISTYEDALEYFLRAEAVQPRFYSLNLLRLGSCYLKLEKEDQAKYYLKLAASYPAKSNDDHQANKEAADLLKRLKC